MQTFLPYPDFEQTAKCLDYRRLGKQRVEAWQLLLVMSEGRKAWSNHPAFKMWDGYDIALVLYGVTMCKEWKARRYKDTLEDKFMNLPLAYENFDMPPWLGDNKFHSAHRSALLFKNYDFYSQFGWSETPELNYIWPV